MLTVDKEKLKKEYADAQVQSEIIDITVQCYETQRSAKEILNRDLKQKIDYCKNINQEIVQNVHNSQAIIREKIAKLSGYVKALNAKSQINFNKSNETENVETVNKHK